MRPLTIDIIKPDKPLSANREHEIRCRTTGSRPPPRMSWFKGSIRLTNNKEFISDDKNITTSILKITPTEDDNGKHLVCRADNPSVPESTKESSWMMDIHCKYRLVVQCLCFSPQCTDCTFRLTLGKLERYTLAKDADC